MSEIVMLEDAAPAVVGANCTVNDALCPVPSVVERFVTLNPLPPPLTELITRFAFPVFVSCTDWLAVCPVITFPKLNDVADIVKADIVPVPFSETLKGESVALLITVIVPDAAEADCGAN